MFLTIIIEEDPHVTEFERIEVEKLDAGFWRVRGRYGFMEEPNVPEVLKRAAEHGLHVPEGVFEFTLQATIQRVVDEARRLAEQVEP